jgi:SAM-dependent methyltransferase
VDGFRFVVHEPVPPFKPSQSQGEHDVTNQAGFDQKKMEHFVHKALGDVSGAYVTLMANLGDRLGIFKALADSKPVDSEELGVRAGINERYAREWLNAMACAGYVEYDPASARFTLPPEHVPVLAQEDGPVFFGGMLQMFPGSVGVLDQVAQSFQEGGGVPQSAYGDHFWCGLERLTGGWFENLLLQQWIPAMPEVQDKLQNGAAMAHLTALADLGSGNGRALIKLAQSFPTSRYVGYDIYEPAVVRSKANATDAKVTDRVSFKQLDVVKGLPEQYDVITTFDVIHDMANPRGALRAIREGLEPDGTYVMLEINSSDKLEENIGPLHAMFYSVSVMYCMTSSLAQGGEGLGTCGLPEPKVREFCKDAGFSSIRRLPLEDPFSVLYEIKP